MATAAVVSRSVGFSSKRFHVATKSAKGGNGGSLSIRHILVIGSISTG